MSEYPMTEPPLLWNDKFDADSRGAYTYVGATSAALAVAGGELTGASSGEKLMYPSVMGTRKSAVAKAKFRFTGSASHYTGWAFRATGINDYLEAIIDTDAAPSLKLYSKSGGAYTQLGGGSAAIPGFARGTNYWLLAACLGDALWASIFTSDPDAALVDPIASIVGNLRSTPFDSNTAGRVALRVLNNTDNNFFIDDVKIWPGNNHPYDF